MVVELRIKMQMQPKAGLIPVQISCRHVWPDMMELHGMGKS